MPLTAEIADSASPLRRWFATRLPHVDRLAGSWTAALQGARTLRPSHAGRVDWPRLGTAFGLRLGFTADAAPPYEALYGVSIVTGDDLLRHDTARLFPTHALFQPIWPAGDLRPLPGGQLLIVPPFSDSATLLPNPATNGLRDFLTRLAGFATAYLHPPGPPHPGVERQAARACWALALFEGVARRGPSALPDTFPPPEELTSDYLMGLAPGYALDDLAALGTALLTDGWPQLAALTADPRQVVVAPTFLHGWADGDLVLGDCLVDCKTTVRPDPLPADWVYQLLGYALLDAAGRYSLRRVGIYLARQARLITWPLDQLVATLTDTPTSWAQLQTEFTAVLAGTLDATSPGWTRRWLTAPPSSAAAG